jgi:hypothetical protein
MKEFRVYSSWLVVWNRITDSSEQIAGGGKETLRLCSRQAGE